VQVMREGMPQPHRALQRVATLAAKGLRLSSPGHVAAEMPAQAVRELDEVEEGQAGWVPAGPVGPGQTWRAAGPARWRWRFVAS
jgi:hypothetical protein